MDTWVIVFLLLEAVLAFFLARTSGALTSFRRNIAAALLILLAFFIRFTLLDYETTDYQWFLTKWVDFYRANGGFSGLKESIGNYNIPYLYFLSLFSYSSIRDLYLIKLLSIFFDVLTAWGVLLMIRNCGSSPLRSLVGFFSVLFLPTVILNSAKWAQCDSIYTAFAVLGVAVGTGTDRDGFRGKNRARGMLSMILIALSFSFKLQAVFIMPVFVILWAWKNYNRLDFALFPLTYLLVILPAVFFGRPFMDALMLYADQAGSVGSALNYNAPSMTALMRSVNDPDLVSKVCIVLAFLAMLLILVYGVRNRKRLDGPQFLSLTVLTVLAIPFLLPHMHDRYFFLADTLTVALACCASPARVPGGSSRKLTVQNDQAIRILNAVCVQYGSLICYIAYFRSYYLRVGTVFLTNRSGAFAVILALLFTGYSLHLRRCPRKARGETLLNQKQYHHPGGTKEK